MLRDAAFALAALWWHHRERRAALSALVDVATALRACVRDPRSSPRTQTNLIGELLAAVDRYERAMGGRA